MLSVLQDLAVLQDHETIKQLGHILKTNVRACTAVGHPFVTQVRVCVCVGGGGGEGVWVVRCVCVCVGGGCTHMPHSPHLANVSFCTQLGRIYLDMLNVYKVLSENISNAVALNGRQ